MRVTLLRCIVTFMIVGSTYLSYSNYQKNSLNDMWYQMPIGGPN